MLIKWDANFNLKKATIRAIGEIFLMKDELYFSIAHVMRIH